MFSDFDIIEPLIMYAKHYQSHDDYKQVLKRYWHGGLPIILWNDMSIINCYVTFNKCISLEIKYFLKITNKGKKEVITFLQPFRCYSVVIKLDTNYFIVLTNFSKLYEVSYTMWVANKIQFTYDISSMYISILRIAYIVLPWLSKPICHFKWFLLRFDFSIILWHHLINNLAWLRSLKFKIPYFISKQKKINK